MNAWILEHGKTTAVFPQKRITPETVELHIGAASYLVGFTENHEKYSYLVVVDGVLLPHGLPASACILKNIPKGKTKAFWYDEEIPERLTASSPIGKVRRGSGLPHGAQLLELPDMLDYHKAKDGKVEVTFARWFMALQKRQNEQILFFRYKPISLERQYIGIQPHPSEVRFVTLNR